MTSSLTLAFLERHPDDAARVLERLAPEQTETLLAELPARALGPVVERMLPSPAARALSLLDDPKIAALLGTMSRLGAAAVLRHLPARRAALLKLLPRLMSRGIRRQLEYPIDTVGAWMDPAVLRLRASTRVEQALELVRRDPDEPRGTIYVVGEDQTLIGCVEVERLVRARPRLSAGQLARNPERVLQATANLQWVADDPAWLRTGVLPVLDLGRLVGALHQSDLHRGLQAHATPSEHGITAQTVEAGVQIYWSALATLLSSGLAWLDLLAETAEDRGRHGR
jgi:Mg/Co/Ni transporter MgtE